MDHSNHEPNHNPPMDDSIESSQSCQPFCDSSSKKLCWVCFGTEQEDEGPDVVWTSPCQCKGTMKWVHEECLQRWIDETQERTNSCRVSCSQCKTYYTLCFPPVNCVVKLIEQYDKFLYSSSPFVAVSAVVGSVYWCCGSYGFISIIQIMGCEEGTTMINELDPLVLVIGLPVIPITLILAKLIKWEDFVLRLWKQNMFGLPRPLTHLIEEPPASPRANGNHILVDPGLNEPLNCTRMICGALILPTISSLVGKLLFSSFTSSQWRRSLLGGLAFLLIKGALKIYLRKSQYVRYCQRTIKNHPAHSKNQPYDQSPSSRHGHSSDDYQDSSGADDDYLPDDVDLPRPRRVLSMTIRI